VHAATILGDRDFGSLDLSPARFAAELRHELVDLSEAGRTDRVTLRFEPA